MSDNPPIQLSSSKLVRELFADFDSLLGVDGIFWERVQDGNLTIETPEQIQNLCRDLLVDLFGMEVRGL
jgi:hypothetical protein